MDTTSQTTSCWTFSAVQYFEQCARGEIEPRGLVPFQIELAENTTIRAENTNSSLFVIDGMYADALSQEAFLTTLQSGEVPKPVVPPASRTLHSKVVCALPECLLTSPQTVLSACGLVPYVLNLGLRSKLCACSQCAARCSRYTSPMELLNAIAKDWQGDTISIYAESQQSRLAEWAHSQGLTVDTTTQGNQSVHLDTIICEAPAIVSLSRLVHSAWRVPSLLFTCTNAGKTSLSYSPSGWCPHCRTVENPTSRANLRQIATHGLKVSEIPLPDSQVFLDDTTTIMQLLSAPLRELHLEPNSALHRAQVLLMRFSLSELSFGSKTNTLSARELAIVSIISCFLAATGSHQQLILDLPAHLLTHTDIDHIRAMWMGLTNTCKVHYVGNSLDPAQPIDDTPCVSYKTNQTILTLSSTAPPSHKNHPCVIHRGELLQVRQHSHDSTNSFYSLATRVSSAIETSGSSAQLIPIPVFPTAAKSFRVIGEVLGLLDPLAQLYAASLDARMHGLTPKDFSLFGARSHRYRCHVCRGLGVVLTHNDNLPRPLAAPCTTCRGLRCKNPVSSSLFRGVSFSTMLNQSISHSQSTLSALVKAKRTIDTVVSLDLHHLPLGMPVALLSRSEHQRLLVAQAVQQSRATKPVIVVVEEPRAGLTEKHYQAIQTVRDVGLREGTLAWIETYSLRT